jgi:hypothetical protein
LSSIEDGMPRRTPPPSPSSAVTPERFIRLVRLVRLLAEKPHTRPQLAKRLRLDLRGFYRDLELLRTAGVAVTLDNGRYGLFGAVAAALAHLPFPDPHLTLGEAEQLAKGRTTVHRKLRGLLAPLRPK